MIINKKWINNPIRIVSNIAYTQDKNYKDKLG